MAPQSLFSYGRGRKQTSLEFSLNVGRHCEDVTSDGRLFQVLAAATGNARSPIVESCVSGTASAADTKVTRSSSLAQG